MDRRQVSGAEMEKVCRILPGTVFFQEFEM